MPNSPNRSPWLRRILIAVGLMGFLCVGLLYVLSRFLDPETLASSLEPRMEAVLAREVEIGRAEVGLFPLGMRLQDVSVADPTGLSPTLARIESAEFQVDLLPLFKKRVQISRLVLVNPEATLRVASDGFSNFGDFSAQTSQETQSQEPAPAEAFTLELRGIHVSNGQLSLINEEASTSVSMGDLQLRATVQQEATGAWIFVGNSEGMVSFEGGSDTLGPRSLPIALSFDILAEPSFEELEVRGGSIGIEPVALALAGQIRGLKEPLREVSLSLMGEGIPISRLVEVLPENHRSRFPGETNGNVEVDLRIDGEVGLGAKPEVSGTVRLTGGSFSNDGARLARNLSADFTLESGGSVLVSAQGEVMDGPFSLEGEGELGGERNVDLQLDVYPDLELVGSLMELPEGVTTLGRLKADVRISGPASDPRNLRFSGEASPSQIRVTSPVLGAPLTVPEGVISFRGQRATFRDLPFLFDRDQFFATGEIRNLTSFGDEGRTVATRLSIRGSKLDLVRLNTKPPPDPALSYGKVAFARVGGRQVAGRSVEDAARELRLLRPDSFPMAGVMTLAFDTVIDAKGQMQNLRAVVEFGPEFLRVSDLRFRKYGGDLQARLNLLLGEQAQEPFSMSLDVEGLDAEAFLGATSPLGEIIRGQLSMSMELVGSLDSLLLPHRPSLVGSGSFSLSEGGLNSNTTTESLATFLGLSEIRNPDIRDWTTSFALENGRVRLADAILGGAPGEPQVGGSVGLNGELDLLSIFFLPSDRLSSFARQNLGLVGEMAGRVANRPDVVQAAVHIGGSILRPDIIADPGAAAGTISSAVGEEIQTEAQRRIREQTNQLQNRAAGFLRGLTRSQEGGDTTPPDTIRPDTVPPDTVPPDTVAPDTLVPDTIPPDTTRLGIAVQFPIQP